MEDISDITNRSAARHLLRWSVFAAPITLSALFSVALFVVPLPFVIIAIVGLLGGLASLYLPYRIIIFFLLVPIAQTGFGLIPDHPGFGVYDIYLLWLIGLFLFSLITSQQKSIRFPYPIIAVFVLLLSWLPGIVAVRDFGYTGRYAFSFVLNIITMFMIYYYLQHKAVKVNYRLLLEILVVATSGFAIYGIYLTATSSSIVNIIVSRYANELTGDPNYYSCYLVMVLSLSIGLATNATSGIRQLIYIACTLLLVVAVVLTISRAGYATLVIVLIAYGVYFYFKFDIKRILATMAGVIVLGTAAVLITTNMGSVFVNVLNISDRVESAASGEDRSINQRQNILIVASRMIADNTIIGVGYGNFEAAYNSYQRGLLSTEPSRVAHNTYITIQAENGIIGFAGAAVFFAAIFIFLMRAFRRAKTLPVQTTLFSLIMSLLAFMAMAATLELLPEPRFWIFTALALSYAKHEVYDKIEDGGLSTSNS